MRKRIIGMIVIGTSLLLASCGSRGEVKRGADGKQVLSGYITLSVLSPFIRWRYSGQMSFIAFTPKWISISRLVELERELPMFLPTR